MYAYIYLYIHYIYNVYIYIHIHTHYLYTHTYIYIYIYLCTYIIYMYIICIHLGSCSLFFLIPRLSTSVLLASECLVLQTFSRLEIACNWDSINIHNGEKSIYEAHQTPLARFPKEVVQIPTYNHPQDLECLKIHHLRSKKSWFFIKKKVNLSSHVIALEPSTCHPTNFI